jgi:hypothetical protein
MTNSPQAKKMKKKTNKRASKNKDDFGWAGDPSKRQAAVIAFIQRLEKDPTTRAKCCDPTDPHDTARETFLKAGGYTGVPSDVQVRVFEMDTELPGDKLVTLILPKKKINPKTFKYRKAWVCTYVLWTPT